MSDGDNQKPKKLSLNQVQMLVGRAMVDDAFRKALVGDPLGTAATLGIHVDSSAEQLLETIAGALTDDASIADAQQKIRDAYMNSTDGIIRPRCG